MSREFQNPALCALLAAAMLSGCNGVDRAMGVPTNLVSHQLCSAVFVGGLDPDSFYREAVEPMIAPTGALMHYDIDRDGKIVTASLAGLVHSRAVYRGALGCQVDHGLPPQSVHSEPPAAPLLPAIAGPDLVAPATPALAAALDRAFAETPSDPHRYTKAIVVVHDGRIVAERYAPGIGPDTPLIGWSMTKSVTNAMLGILVREGRLSMTGPAPIKAWSGPADPRHAIAIDDLLRMASGIDFGQSLSADWHSAFDPSAQMEFDAADEAGEAEKATLKFEPGTDWTYTNGNTLLLSRIIRDAAGGDADAVEQFLHRELLDKLGMAHATMEFDSVGTPIGSSHMWAPARDWARFGLLYLNDGVVGGARILPAGWVDYSARLTPHSETYGYGAGFWTNRGDSGGALLRQLGGMPKDAFMARGTQGQYTIIVPSARLVIVRMGWAETWHDDIDTVDRLVGDIVAAVKAGN